MFKRLTFGMALVLSIQFVQAQIYTPSGLITGASGNTNVGIGTGLITPTAKLDIYGAASFTGDALRLRAGSAFNSTTSNQILFSYLGSTNYTHAIKSRHHSGQDAGNALDFYVWDYGTDAAATIGSKLVMSLNGGNVGIGTNSPTEKVHIVDGRLKLSITTGFNTNNKIILDPSYDLGGEVGNTPIIIANSMLGLSFYDPEETRYNKYISLTAGSIYFRSSYSSEYGMISSMSNWAMVFSSLSGGSSKDKVYISHEGWAKFDGKVTCKEVLVQTDVWADYVFNADYALRPLAEVERFINANNHLPEVPGEAEVLQNGINVSEMNALLLKKIEELTLYSIQQQKEIEVLKTAMQQLVK